MNITAKTKICMVIGDPIEHSLSPQLHNAGYKALHIENDYVFVGCAVKSEHLEDFMKGVRAMNVRGISVTIPHKIAVMQYLDEIDETAKKIGAVNTIVNDHGVLKGYNTDWIGVIKAIENLTKLKDKKVAVLGAGGAARAVIYGVTQKGAKAAVLNRTIEKAEELKEHFDITSYLLTEITTVKESEIIINITSVGMLPNINESPIAKDLIKPSHIVLDAVYNPYETQLLKDAKEQGATIIHGTEMLLYQGAEQFALYTGKEAPIDTMRKSIELSLRANGEAIS